MNRASSRHRRLLQSVGAFALAVFAAAYAGGAACAQSPAPVEYKVSFENAVHHEARISVTYRDIGDAPLVLYMSRTSPGRYSLHNFAKNVYAVEAVDGAGKTLSVTRDDPFSWRVGGHDGTVTVTYTLYADRADGTYSQIDLTHAHLCMPATFMWAKGFDDRPITVAFKPSDHRWKVATQLAPTRGRMTFTAPDLQYFMDSPTELSDFVMREWTLGEGENHRSYRLAVHHDGDKKDVDVFAAKVKKIVAEEIKIFGGAPHYDYGVYTFIAGYLPYVSGDGMEHRNSTTMTGPRSLYESDFSQIGTAAHEFFHSWNSERMRAAGLEPFDFTHANPTRSLWFAEGFTSYYGPLAIRRAGESTVAEYLDDVGGTLSAVINAPGRQMGSPQSMSLLSTLVDRAAANNPDNFANDYISYYPYGEVIALALDLTLRSRFQGLTLDDYMRHMWKAHQDVQSPYTPDDLRKGLAETTGDAAFAQDFFARYIEASDLPDFEPLLAQAGLALVPKDEKAAYVGRASFEEFDGGLAIASNPIKGSPLYQAGLERGDVIRKLGRLKIRNEDSWNRALKRFKPGEKTTIMFDGRGGARAASITFAKDNALVIKPFEDIDRNLTDEQKAFRDAWLGTDSDSKDD